MRATYLSWTGRVFLLMLVAAIGCSKKQTHSAVVMKDSGPRSGAGAFDFDGDVPLPYDYDAGAPDPGTPEPGLVGPCAIDSNKIFTAVESDRPFLTTPLGVDLGGSIFAVPYLGDSKSCLDAIFVTTLQGSNLGPAPASTLAVDACSQPRSPVMTHVGDHWLLAAVDNRSSDAGVSSYDVWVQTWDVTGKQTDPGQRVSDSLGAETALAISALRDGNVMLAWVDTAADGSGSVHVRALDATGTPRGPEQVLDSWNKTAGTDPTKNPKLMYSGLTLAALGPSGAALAYWRVDAATGTHSEIVLDALDGTGKTTRPEWVLTRNAGTQASVDITVNEEGGAVIYTQAEAATGRQVWFQQIDDTGKAAGVRLGTGTAPAVRVVNAPTKAIDVSITKLLSNYVMAFRALPTADGTRAKIRMAFLNQVGNVFGDLDVSYTSDTGGKTAIKAAYDGRIVLAWSEVEDNGKSLIKMGRLPCVGGP